MVFTVIEATSEGDVEFEDALDKAGVGFRSWRLLGSCCLLLLAMYLDLFGLSMALPAAACDLGLDTQQSALLSAVPLVGVMVMSWWWGLAADLLGRRSTLLAAMSVGFVFSVAASLAPGYASLCVLKFISSAFSASANAAGFVLVGEMTPRSHRTRFLFLMASTTMFTQFIIAVVARAVLPLTFRLSVPVLDVELRPWRLLLLLLSLPGALGVLTLTRCSESAKYLLANGRRMEALVAICLLYRGKSRHAFSVKSLYLAESTCSTQSKNRRLLRRMWDQTAPLFRPPLLKHSLIIYYILLTAYMTSTGYTMWVPMLTNMYFDGGDYRGHTFCDVASGTAATGASHNTTTSWKDCNSPVSPRTLYAVMLYSGGSGTINLLLSLVAGRVGRRRSTLLVFSASAVCGVLLHFVASPLPSLAVFYSFLYVCLVLASLNSYIVELYPTQLRGMATCLSVVISRGSGFLSVNLIARALPTHCHITVGAFTVLVASGGVVSLFLPPDQRKPISNEKNNPST